MNTDAAANARTALIAEDEPLLAAQLQAELARLWPALSIVATATDGLQASALALERRPDLLFLDIRMPGASGLEAAQAIAEDWPDEVPLPLIVYVTAYDEFALRAFETNAIDYVLKPVTPERLQRTLEKVRLRLAERAGTADPMLEQLRALLQQQQPPAAIVDRLELIPAQTGSTVHLVPVEDVLYFEAADKYIRVVTASAEHLIRMPLRELLPRLDPARFWQIHRGTVVQVRAVARAVLDDTGKLRLQLHDRADKLVVSRLYAHRWKGL